MPADAEADASHAVRIKALEAQLDEITKLLMHNEGKVTTPTPVPSAATKQLDLSTFFSPQGRSNN